MKNLVAILILGTSLFISCQKDKHSDKPKDTWEITNINVDEKIEASYVVDSKLFMASENSIFELSITHEVKQFETETTRNWQFREAKFSDKLLLRFTSYDTLTSLEFRPIHNIPEKYSIGLEELGLDHAIVVRGHTVGAFIGPTKFVLGARDLLNHQQFIVELDIQLNEASQSIEDINVGERIYLPPMETSFETTADISDLRKIEDLLFINMGLLDGAYIFDEGQLSFMPSLDIKSLYEENGAWYSTKPWENSLKKSEDKGLSWTDLEFRVIANNFRKIGNQTVALSEYNDFIYMVGESIEDLKDFDLEFNDGEYNFDLLEFFNGKVYLGNYYFSENKFKLFTKTQL